MLQWTVRNASIKFSIERKHYIILIRARWIRYMSFRVWSDLCDSNVVFFSSLGENKSNNPLA